MIYLASDHAGFELKEKLKSFLGDLSFEVEDIGNVRHEEGDDYPDFIFPAARKVSEDPENNRAIIIGGSGQGEAIAANRIKGVRAAVFYGGPIDIIKLSREHNDANILSLGARFIFEDEAREVVKMWLETPFSGGERHKRRIEKIDKI
ncbi:MAG: ribose-5-phosphate isomerase [Parcubacteria group bacterium CG10_big_fil_rev_8_21_14_0_10_38_31]|nr:MAG: ribose-5-phosphate isomerase [Parcubacteria group bacterium CG10_big_fil_rev_8_21_14_0_10_38_31]